MRSRFALVSLIVTGLLMSGGGASLAISGVSGQGGAAENQYTTPTPPPTPTTAATPTTPAPPPEVATEDSLVPAETEASAPADRKKTASPAEKPASKTEAAAPAEQVAVASESGGDTLPFTGFLAIPLMIGGVALVSTGALMRRKWRKSDD
jgi:hypothetical protein